MKIFPHANMKGDPCIICNTHVDKAVALVPIIETIQSDEHFVQALQIHLECIELWYHRDKKLLYQKLDLPKKKK